MGAKDPFPANALKICKSSIQESAEGLSYWIGERGAQNAQGRKRPLQIFNHTGTEGGSSAAKHGTEAGLLGHHISITCTAGITAAPSQDMPSLQPAKPTSSGSTMVKPMSHDSQVTITPRERRTAVKIWRRGSPSCTSGGGPRLTVDLAAYVANQSLEHGFATTFDHGSSRSITEIRLPEWFAKQSWFSTRNSTGGCWMPAHMPPVGNYALVRQHPGSRQDVFVWSEEMMVRVGSVLLKTSGTCLNGITSKGAEGGMTCSFQADSAHSTFFLCLEAEAQDLQPIFTFLSEAGGCILDTSKIWGTHCFKMTALLPRAYLLHFVASLAQAASGSMLPMVSPVTHRKDRDEDLPALYEEEDAATHTKADKMLELPQYPPFLENQSRGENTAAKKAQYLCEWTPLNEWWSPPCWWTLQGGEGPRDAHTIEATMVPIISGETISPFSDEMRPLPANSAINTSIKGCNVEASPLRDVTNTSILNLGSGTARTVALSGKEQHPCGSLHETGSCQLARAPNLQKPQKGACSTEPASIKYPNAEIEPEAPEGVTNNGNSSVFELAAPADRFDRLLLELGESQAAGKHVVVVNDEETCNKLFISLLKEGYSASTVHGGQDQIVNDVTIQDFTSGFADILIATADAIRDLSVGSAAVVSYNPPTSVNDFTLRVSLAGAEGSHLILVSKDDKEVMGNDLITLVFSTTASLPGVQKLDQPVSSGIPKSSRQPLGTLVHRLTPLQDEWGLNDVSTLGGQTDDHICEDTGEQEADDDVWHAIHTEGLQRGWLRSPSEVELGAELGRGSFAVTCEGMLCGELVAVKITKLLNNDSSSMLFLRELSILTNLSHPNLLGFKGAVLCPPNECWLVTEYKPGGSLTEWLYGGNGRPYMKRSLLEKLNMCLGVATGMLALQTSAPPVIHRDLKPANILLDESGAPCVADFGLARQCFEDEAHTLTGETGSYTYMAPEVMGGDIYGPAADVYSFGILMVEVFWQRPPFLETGLTPVQVALGALNSELRPELPAGLSGNLEELIVTCWSGEPQLRPSFGTVVLVLQDAVRKAALY